jgi:hypothetical protein
MIIEVGNAPLRKAHRGMLAHVPIDESRGFWARLGSTMTHVPHRLRVRVHDEQVIDVAS